MTEADDADGAKSRIRSTGAAVEAMKTSLGSLNSNLSQLVNDISELMMATAAAAEGVWDVKTKVLECTSFVAENTYLKIQGNGEVVVDLSGKYAGGSMEAKNKGKDLENLIKAALDRARDVDDAYDKRLKAVGDGTYKSSETASSQSQGCRTCRRKAGRLLKSPLGGTPSLLRRKRTSLKTILMISGISMASPLMPAMKPIERSSVRNWSARDMIGMSSRRKLMKRGLMMITLILI